MPADTASPEVETEAEDSDETQSSTLGELNDVPSGDEEEGAEENYFGKEPTLVPMVWDEDKPEDHGITSTEATTSLITAIIGAGIMALPQLPKTGGIVASTSLMLIGTFATMEAGSAFFRAMMANNIALKRGTKATRTYIHSYEDYGFVAYGAAGANLIRVMSISWFIGLDSGYVILMGQNMQNILSPLIFINYRIWVLILSPLLWFLSMMRDVSAIAKLMPLGVGAATASCILIIVKAAMDSDKWEEWPAEDLDQLHNTWPTGNFMSLGSLMATVFGAVGCMANVPSIVDEMKKKHRFKRSFRTALSSVMALYIGIMVIGYYGYGNFIQSNIVKSMTYHPESWEETKLPPEQWTGKRTVLIPTAMSVCVVINLIISYPLNLAPVFISIQGTSYGKENLKPGSKGNYLMRTCIVALTVGIPLLITEFKLVYNLFASICGPVQGVLVPLIFGWNIRKKVGAQGSGIVRKVWQGILIFIAVFCIVFGFSESVQDLIKSF